MNRKRILKLAPSALAAALVYSLSVPYVSAALTGDVNGDSLINSQDASLILAEYSLLSTGEKSGFDAEEKNAADMNGDGLTDANDASAILTYYSYASTGGTLGLSEYVSRLSADKVLKARVIEDDDYTLMNGRYVALSLSIDELLSAFDYNDIVTVSINGRELDMPLSSYITNIDVCPVCLYADPGNKFLFGYEGEKVYIASSYEFMGLSTGLFRRAPEGSPDYYEFNSDLESPVTAEIRLKEKNGYSRLSPIAGVRRSYEREDYPELTDEEYANFRMIHMGDIPEGVLYRSSNPIDPALSRNTYADKAAEEHGVKTFLNLADSEELARYYGSFDTSYYSKQNVIYLNMPLVFGQEDFREKLAAGLRFINDNEGPYLIHCMEGKFRCGFVSAVLECFMGADTDEIEEDFVRTYINYFRVPDELQTEIKRLIDSFLEREFGVNDIHTADTRAEAEKYISGLGLSEEEISCLRDKLSGI